jgi:hypothetical protein
MSARGVHFALTSAQAKAVLAAKSDAPRLICAIHRDGNVACLKEAIVDDAWKRVWLIATFAATLWTAGFLLGTLLPMVGKVLLPKFDDLRPSWNVCLVCLLSAVFLGYGYAHFIAKMALKRQFVVHAAALGLALLTLLPTPLDIGRLDPFGWDPFQGNPILIVALLVMTVVVPLLTAAATIPLLQRWFSFTAHPAAADPYFLYGASLPVRFAE